LVLNAFVGDSAVGAIENHASVSAANTQESDLSNNSALDPTQVVLASDLSLSLRSDVYQGDSILPFLTGQNRHYTLNVNNAGPSGVQTFTLTDILPAGLTFVSGEGDNWSCSADGQNVSCTFASDQPFYGSLPYLTLTVAVGVDAAPQVTNSATVASATFDP